ncbi:XRE family transcriptional regulator [Mesorhizobium sp. M2D.F.Ca.ET.232.01.1.1]|nr:XRE family transcriptional regulator [Mesorhizobium sp. M2D.F.Ca.ET.232.01.1.1]TGQ44069.1 XRE family transcriptional regulator [Mesorhizobium sp. M00.F.Ca.ET.220.01.1.1]TGT95022.1 XRE family transcriptional regulator [bacterium M00.F.Ca.ET.163.01.1.1]
MHIRQWRKFRRMKMETLASRTGLAVGTISAIETGKQGYSRASLEAISQALRTRPGYLLEFDPTKQQEVTIRLN